MRAPLNFKCVMMMVRDMKIYNTLLLPDNFRMGLFTYGTHNNVAMLAEIHTMMLMRVQIISTNMLDNNKDTTKLSSIIVIVITPAEIHLLQDVGLTQREVFL